MAHFRYFILDEDEFDEVQNLTLDFEIPDTFSKAQKYVPRNVRHDAFEEVPSAVGSAIFNALPIDVPFDPIFVFLYLRNGRLPEFVIAYFMGFELPKRTVSKMSLFYRAVHLVSMFREAVVFPKSHFMSQCVDEALDQVAADKLASDKPEVAEEEEEGELVICEDEVEDETMG